MTLQSLLDWAKPVADRIRESGNAEATNVGTRLHASARHVASARLGAELFMNPNLLAEPSSATVQTGGLMMTFGSGQTSLDLCASALLRWIGDVPKVGRDHDFGNLRERVRGGSVCLPAGGIQSWYDSVDQSDSGADLRDFRDAIIHRIVGQGVIARPGGQHSYFLSPSTGEARTEEASVMLTRFVVFTEDRWRQFWEAFPVEGR